jgi:signal transduction histidine kinase
MKISLKGKLILSYLAVALITVLVVSALIRLNSGQSLMNLVIQEQTASLTEAVQTYYASNGSLEGFFNYYLQTNTSQRGPAQPENQEKPSQTHEIRGVKGLVDTNNNALMPTLGYVVGQAVPADELKGKIAVEVDGETIAWILPDTSNQFALNTEEEVFLQRTTLAIGLAAAAGILAAVVMGFILAGGLLKPIRRLTNASRALAQGNLQQKVPVTSFDELGQLTDTFNQMSNDLAQADAQRKRITADITHDLSTPLQIISGYIEMLDSGEVTLSPQRLEIIKSEIEHLRRMVGHLGTLTQVESGALDIQLQPVNPSALLKQVFHTYQPIAARQGVELFLETSDEPYEILVDEGRMLQVLQNLMENALRYTTRGGRITLSETRDKEIQLRVTDTGSGIDPEDLPYVFDRFYRADKSRGGIPGKMGLGLAICKALVTAQGGEIHVESKGRNQGASMMITFSSVVISED